MQTRDTVAVIGASGFLGSALTRRLGELGIPAACFTRSCPFLRPDGTLTDEIADAKTVFWLASSVRPATAETHPELVADDHRALQTLLDASRREDRRFRVVAASSGGTVYDVSARPPYSERTPVAPDHAYGRAMAGIEQLTRSSGRGVILRVSNAYGPGQQPLRGQGVIAHWLAAIAAGKPIHMIGSPDSARDYVYVDDVADAFVCAHLATDPPPVVNIGSGEPTSLGVLLDHVRDVVAPMDVRVLSEPARSFDAPTTWLDVGLADRSLGWRPRVSLRDGLGAMWQDVGVRQALRADARAVNG